VTTPRQILPGRTYLITRRSTQRQYLLRPDEKTNQIFLYCLAVAALLFGIEINMWLAMSNHYHVVLFDPHGRLPAFLRHFNQLCAKALNARWSRRENLWSSEQPSAVHLIEDDDVLDKSVYGLVNPAADHLVESVADWPGASSWSAHLNGKPIVIKRPRIFFRKGGSMPEEVVLSAVAPRRTSDPSQQWDLAEWQELLRARVHAAEQAALQERLTQGKRVLGRRAVRKQSPFASPTTPVKRGGLRPTVACRNGERLRGALAALRHFRESYYLARQRFLNGDRSVTFPEGTWALRAFCATAGGVKAESPS
jgi:putative transposase